MQVQHTESKETLKNVDKPRVFTVWQKSSMGFQGTYGFSVYDNSGQLVFRVDNYSRRQKYLTKEIVFMDGNGKALICLRPRVCDATYIYFRKNKWTLLDTSLGIFQFWQSLSALLLNRCILVAFGFEIQSEVLALDFLFYNFFSVNNTIIMFVNLCSSYMTLQNFQIYQLSYILYIDVLNSYLIW